MTGRDTVNARFLHENSFDFNPQFKLYINANYLPVVTDTTLFTSNRMHIIPFDRHFGEDEQDHTLKTEFQKPKNQSAILNWLVGGYKLLVMEGLNQPKSVLSATDSYAYDSDKVAQFIEEMLTPEAGAEERTSDVYDQYRKWCTRNGGYAEGAKNFKQALSKIAKIERKRPRSGGNMTTIMIGFKLIRPSNDQLHFSDYPDL